jgi:hypothetical protein
MLLWNTTSQTHWGHEGNSKEMDINSVFIEIRGRLQPFFANFNWLDFLLKYWFVEEASPTLASVLPLISKYRQAG